MGVTDIAQCKYYDAYHFQKNWQKLRSKVTFVFYNNFFIIFLVRCCNQTLSIFLSCEREHNGKTNSFMYYFEKLLP